MSSRKFVDRKRDREDLVCVLKEMHASWGFIYTMSLTKRSLVIRKLQATLSFCRLLLKIRQNSSCNLVVESILQLYPSCETYQRKYEGISGNMVEETWRRRREERSEKSKWRNMREWRQRDKA